MFICDFYYIIMHVGTYKHGVRVLAIIVCRCYQYDLNGDGVLEFVLTTTDAEILFIQTDNTLLHGETIKVGT